MPRPYPKEFRDGIGWGLERDAEVLDTLDRSTTRLRQEIPQRAAAIERVVDDLTRELKRIGRGLYLLDDDAKLSLNADEVAALIENN